MPPSPPASTRPRSTATALSAVLAGAVVVVVIVLVAPRLLASDQKSSSSESSNSSDSKSSNGSGDSSNSSKECSNHSQASSKDSNNLVLLFRFDRAARWSETPDWRRLNRCGWSPLDGFRTRSANLDPAGFATPASQRSPRWDLVTFLAALLLDPPGDDGGIGCRLISETNFVRRRAGVMIGATRCAAFEDWADLDSTSAR